MGKWIDSTNYLGKEGTGWSDLDWLDGHSASGFLGWVYEWEACQKNVGYGGGVATKPDIRRISAFADRMKDCEYAVIDIEAPEVNFINNSGLVAKYLRTAEVARPDVKWIWYNTHIPPWKVWQSSKGLPSTQQLVDWRKQWSLAMSKFELFQRVMVSYYPKTIREVLSYLPHMLTMVREASPSKEIFWNMAIQTHAADVATSPIKDFRTLELELEYLAIAVKQNLVDYVSVWGLFNTDLPRLDLRNNLLTKDVVKLFKDVMSR